MEATTGVDDIKKLLAECLAGMDSCSSSCPDATKINKCKTSSDLLAVHFPTFAARHPRSFSITPQQQLTYSEQQKAYEPTTTQLQRSKYSSTSTLYLQNTITRPDLMEVIQCISKALHVHISKGAANVNKVYLNAFCELANPLVVGWDVVQTPTAYVLNDFISVIFQYHKMDVECAIMSLVYIERFLEITNVTMDSTNWRRIVLAAIIVANKVWEEHAVWTQDFMHLFDHCVANQDLNNLEFQFLGLIRYNLAITATTYAKYYFELRTFSREISKLPATPLRKKAAKRLEKQSSRADMAYDRARSMSTSSTLPEHLAQAVIN